MPKLVIVQAEVAGEGTPVIEFDDQEITLGRSRDNTVVLNEPSVSRRHAKLMPGDGGWLLVDLGSANGTFVNKKRITEQLLSHGDVVLLGRAELRFEAEEAPAATVMFDVEPMAPPAPGPPAPQAPPPPPPTPAQPQAVPGPPPQAPPPPPVAAPAPPPPPVAAPAPPPPPVAAPVPPPPVSVPSATPPGVPLAPEPSWEQGGEYGGFLPRLAAYLIDGLIVSAGILVVMLVFGGIGAVLMRKVPALGALLMGLGYLLAFALSIGYFVHFWARSGATPGKKLLHLKVVRDDGVEPPGHGTAILRVLGYMVNGFTMNIGFLMILFTPDRRGLHDMIAKTHVIRTE